MSPDPLKAAEGVEEPREIRLRHGQLQFLIREILKRKRVPPELASHTADAMVAANLAGEDAQGVATLPALVDGLSTRQIKRQPMMRLAGSSGGTAVLDGDHGPGPAVARRGMVEAISAANRHGVGAVAARRTGPPGYAAHFAAMALSHQMAGVALATARTPALRGEEDPPPAHPVALGIAVPTAETAPPMILNVTFPEQGGAAGADLALALESLLLLSGCALAPDLHAQARPEPLHAGGGQLFLAFRIRAFAPWAGFRNQMVERLKHLRRARIGYPGQTAESIEEQRRILGIPLDPPTAAELGRLAAAAALHDTWLRLTRPS